MWKRWNQTSHIWERSTDNGLNWSPLPINGASINEGTIPGVAYLAPNQTFSGQNTFANSEVYQTANTYVRYNLRVPSEPTLKQTFVIINYQQYLQICPANDLGTNTPSGDGDWFQGIRLDHAGNVAVKGELRSIGSTVAQSRLYWGAVYGSAYLEYDGANTTLFGGGNIVLGVANYGNVVRLINSSGPYVGWDGTTYSDLWSPQYLRLYPANGNILAFGAISIGASYDGGGPKLVNDYGNSNAGSLRLDVSGLSFYWRGTGTNAFFATPPGGANSGNASYPWAAVYAYAGTIQPSDASLKENLQPNILGLEFIEKLKAVQFDYVGDTARTGYVGYIAQDVEEALAGQPFAALDKPAEGPSGLNYAGFVPVITQAIQELSARLRALETP